MIEISSLFDCFGSSSNSRGGGGNRGEDECSSYSDVSGGGAGAVAGWCGGDYDNDEPLDVMECNSKGTNITSRSHGGTSSNDEDVDDGRRRQQLRRSSRRHRRDYNYVFPYQKSFIEWFVDGIISSSGYGKNDHDLNVTGKRNIEHKCESYNNNNIENGNENTNNNMNMYVEDGRKQRRDENTKVENGGGINNNPASRVRSILSYFSNNSSKKGIPTTITATTTTTTTTAAPATTTRTPSPPAPTATASGTLPTTTTTAITNHTKNSSNCSCKRFMKFAASILGVLMVAALIYYVLKKDLFTAHIL